MAPRPFLRPAVISIHALREEGDMQQLFAMQMQQQFLSTPSARRATSTGWIARRHFLISIHALREEGDGP